MQIHSYVRAGGIAVIKTHAKKLKTNGQHFEVATLHGSKAESDVSIVSMKCSFRAFICAINGDVT